MKNIIMALWISCTLLASGNTMCFGLFPRCLLFNEFYIVWYFIEFQLSDSFRNTKAKTDYYGVTIIYNMDIKCDNSALQNSG